ncbi:MAG: PQQ-like beta-propeller repeat protein [Verrucomicrobia bacterium]|nr:PQQ-like beta-propeller repeat protein [Verrucomicrobiota bacterium]
MKLLLLALAASASASASTPDWPQWRGPKQDGISPEKGLLKEWPSDGPSLAWRVKGVGTGMSSVSISNGRIYTLGVRNRDGVSGVFVTALNLADGREYWATAITTGNGPKPNSTPTVDGKLLYAVGNNGDLACLETDTGKLVWKKSYTADFGGKCMSTWGYSESPLVDGDRLICVPGAAEAGIAALDKKTGEVIWKAAIPSIGRAGLDGAGYTGVVISQGAGVKQYVTLTGRGLVSVRAGDGKFLWGYNRIANSTADIPTPIIKGDYVFGSSGYNDGGTALLKLSKDGAGVKATEVYYLSNSELQNHHGGMILLGDHVYMGHGHNNGFPTCVELMTGKVVWGKERGPGTGSAAIVMADGHLYFRYENGIMALIEATPKSYALKSSFTLASKVAQSWPHPVIHGGKLYIRDQDNLLCYDVKAK